MNLTQDEQGERVIIRCEGRLDAMTSPQLENAMNSWVEKKRNHILIDFSRIDYLSSAGMRLLLSMTKRLRVDQGKCDGRSH